MAIERTLAIIKPDAVARNLQGEILSRIHKAGFRIVAIKTMIFTKGEAAGFYAIHRERPFFGELTDFMSSGKIFALVLEAEGAILKWRDTMGATDPKKAAWQQLHSRLRRPGNRCLRNRLLLFRPRTHLIRNFETPSLRPVRALHLLMFVLLIQNHRGGSGSRASRNQ